MEHILLIDDEVRVLHALKLALFKEKYKLHFANNAEDAMHIVRKHEIAVIVSDHKMPGKNGVDLLADVRKISPNIIRILLTGECDQVCTIDSINKAHVYLYINKPFSGREMRKILNDAICKYHEARIITEQINGDFNLEEAAQTYSINKIELENDYHLLNKLVPGMQLKKDLKDDEGRLIAKAGHPISTRDLQIIRGYTITDRVAISKKLV